jgi:hypothetical protein
MKVLFILKQRESSTGSGYSSGLINSAILVQQILIKNKIESHVIEVVDNNCIDREVTLYKPEVVIIEALWVVPSKLDKLKKIHPNIKWVVRLHSELPFLAIEGIAISWINDYVKSGIIIACNSKRLTYDLSQYLDMKRERVVLLPNYYNNHRATVLCKRSRVLNIGCFGAIRPLKNQLIQAMAAIVYANKKDKQLNFHINVGRIENSGSDNVLKNLRALFDSHSNHSLVEHEWSNHEDFLMLVRQMDLGMQVSLSETFNIVTADFVSCNRPVVVSHEIDWVCDDVKADPNNLKSIVDIITYVLNHDFCLVQNLEGLEKYNNLSSISWNMFLYKESLIGRFINTFKTIVSSCIGR